MMNSGSFDPVTSKLVAGCVFMCLRNIKKDLPTANIPVAACLYSLFVSVCIQPFLAPWQTAVMAGAGDASSSGTMGSVSSLPLKSPLPSPSNQPGSDNLSAAASR